jgi:5-methylcytosine-specific restriction endonuclease McrA
MSDFTITKRADVELSETHKVSKATAWRLNNPEKAAAQKSAYKEKQKLSDAKYYKKNRDSIIARQIAYDAANQKRVREYRADWRSKNTEKVREYLKNWREENKSLCQKYHRNRRARVLGNGGVSSQDIGDRLLKLQKGKCASCRIFLKNKKPHLDHIIPLARGGNGDDKNLQLLCAKCNLQKKAGCPVEFMQSKGYLL